MNKAFQRVRKLKCEACIYITAHILNLLFKNIQAVESSLYDSFNAGTIAVG